MRTHLRFHAFELKSMKVKSLLARPQSKSPSNLESRDELLDQERGTNGFSRDQIFQDVCFMLGDARHFAARLQVAARRSRRYQHTRFRPYGRALLARFHVRRHFVVGCSSLRTFTFQSDQKVRSDRRQVIWCVNPSTRDEMNSKSPLTGCAEIP